MRFDLTEEMSEEDRQAQKEAMAKFVSLATAPATYFDKIIEEWKSSIKDEQQQIFINRSHYLYEQTQNPLFAWDVFKSCQEWNRPVPEWALKYFMECATLLLTFANDGWPKGTRPVDFIPRVLGLSDGKSSRACFTQYNTAHKKLMIYLTVKDVEREFANKEIVRQRGVDKFHIAGDRLGLSGDHVKKIFYSEREALAVLGGEL